MRNLKYAILCLLRRTPMTGYDITKEFQKALGIFWSAHHSQIYPELRRLTEEGLITYSTVIQGEKMEKKLYTITEDGRREHDTWMDQVDEMEPTPKDIFRLKSFFMDSWTDEQRQRQFAQQLRQREGKLAYLEDTMKTSYDGMDFKALTAEQQGDYIVLTGAIMREKAYVDWLQKSMKLLRG